MWRTVLAFASASFHCCLCARVGLAHTLRDRQGSGLRPLFDICPSIVDDDICWTCQYVFTKIVDKSVSVKGVKQGYFTERVGSWWESLALGSGKEKDTLEGICADKPRGMPCSEFVAKLSSRLLSSQVGLEPVMDLVAATDDQQPPFLRAQATCEALSCCKVMALERNELLLEEAGKTKTTTTITTTTTTTTTTTVAAVTTVMEEAQLLRGKEARVSPERAAVALAVCNQIGILIEGKSNPRHRVQVRVWQRFLAHQYGADCVVPLLDPQREDEGELCDQSFCSTSTKEGLASLIKELSFIRQSGRIELPNLASAVVVYMAHGDVGELKLRDGSLHRDEWLMRLKVLHQLTDKVLVYVDACHTASMFTTAILRNGIDTLSIYDERAAGLGGFRSNAKSAAESVASIFGVETDATKLLRDIVTALRMCRMASREALDTSGLIPSLAALLEDSKRLRRSQDLQFDVPEFSAAFDRLHKTSPEARVAMTNHTILRELYNDEDLEYVPCFNEVSTDGSFEDAFYDVTYLDPVAFTCQRGKAQSGGDVGERTAYAAVRALAAILAPAIQSNVSEVDDLLLRMCRDKEESCFGFTATVPSLSSFAISPKEGSYFMNNVVEDLVTHAGRPGNMFEHINRVQTASPISVLRKATRKGFTQFHDVATFKSLMQWIKNYPKFVPTSFGNMLGTSLSDIFPRRLTREDVFKAMP